MKKATLESTARDAICERTASQIQNTTEKGAYISRSIACTCRSAITSCNQCKTKLERRTGLTLTHWLH